MMTYEETFGDLEDKSIYLDNAATTPILPEVYYKMEPYIKLFYGNASSKYKQGEISKRAIEEARSIIAKAIGAEPEEIYFTSGGSEANNWVIKGLRNKFRFRPMHIISTEFEHHSILESLKYRWNECEDIEYTLISPERSGVISVQDLAEAFKLNTELVSVMMVNNELGTIQPIIDIGQRCANNGVIFHTDAVQAFGQLPIDVEKLNISMMSMSAHKIHGPKGVGALYISNGIKSRMNPLIHGGQQERGMRASTENVAAIVGFGKAVEIAMDRMEENFIHKTTLLNYLIEEVQKIPDVYINGEVEYNDGHHLNVRIDGVRSEELMAMLDSANIYISTGSACNSESKQPSHVLKAIGLTDSQANSSIRISISDLTTKEELTTFLEYLKQFIKILRERK